MVLENFAGGEKLHLKIHCILPASAPVPKIKFNRMLAIMRDLTTAFSLVEQFLLAPCHLFEVLPTKLVQKVVVLCAGGTSDEIVGGIHIQWFRHDLTILPLHSNVAF